MKAAGNKAWRQIYVKIIIGRFIQPWRYRANPHCGYTQAEIDGTLENVIEYLDREYPTIDFRQVQVGPNKFNFIAEKVRDCGPSLEEIKRGEDLRGPREPIEEQSGISGFDPAADNQNSSSISQQCDDGHDSHPGVCN